MFRQMFPQISRLKWGFLALLSVALNKATTLTSLYLHGLCSPSLLLGGQLALQVSDLSLQQLDDFFIVLLSTAGLPMHRLRRLQTTLQASVLLYSQTGFLGEMTEGFTRCLQSSSMFSDDSAASETYFTLLNTTGWSYEYVISYFILPAEKSLHSWFSYLNCPTTSRSCTTTPFLIIHQLKNSRHYQQTQFD